MHHFDRQSPILTHDLAAARHASMPDLVTPNPILGLVEALIKAVLYLLRGARWLVAFATITLPSLLVRILGYSLTLQLDFTKLVILFFLWGLAVFFLIRYRYLNKYSKLKESPLASPDPHLLNPSISAPDDLEKPTAFHNYLDEFLAAIRIFGFLEKPVFHELSRHLQTKRLIAGDSISLDAEDKNFYCVVDGNVQVFARSDKSQAVKGDGPYNGYHLLNEVATGGTLSSLFTILSLFTEDVKLRWEGDAATSEDGHVLTAGDSWPQSPFRQDVSGPDSDVSQLDADEMSSTIQGDDDVATPASPSMPLPFTSPRIAALRGSSFKSQRAPSVQQPPPKVDSSVIARATIDTTLAVIPSEAFRRLTSKYPKATGHIVSVILTRFARVTFMTAHRYLGLTKEVLQAEDALNATLSYPLPRSFYEQGGMKALRERFQPELSKSMNASRRDTPDSNGIEIKQTASYKHENGDGYFDLEPTPEKKPSSEFSTPSARRPPQPSRQSTYRAQTANRKLVGAGDLLSMTTIGGEDAHYHRGPTPRTPGPRTPAREKARNKDHFPTIAQIDDEADAEIDLREAIIVSIAESIGLAPAATPDHRATSGAATSTPNSPSVHPSASGRSAFGSSSMLDMLHSEHMKGLKGMVDERSSVTGTGMDASGADVIDLGNDVEILFFKAGRTLVNEGESNPGLFFVIDGFLDVSMSNSHEDSAQTHDEEFLFSIKPGGIAGYLASLCSMPSYVHIRAKTDCYVGLLPHKTLERLIETRPIVLLTLAKRLISLLSPLVMHLDASLDWMQLNSGQVLYREGEPSDSFYIVINGRLRSVNEKESGEVQLVSEYGQGSPIGELEAITGGTRPNTVHAIRDSELVRMPMALFNAVAIQHPATTIRFLRLIASRVQKARAPSREEPSRALGVNLNLKTVCVMPATRNVPIAAFADKLRASLEDIGAPTSYLDQASAMSRLGRHAFSKMGKLKVAGWLAEQEQRYRIVLYVVDTAVSSQWTMTSIRQADFILVVGMGDEVALGEYEKLLLASKTTARKELVLLHPERSVPPGSTRRWLQERPYVSAHHHVELSGLVLPNSKTTVHDPGAVAAFKHLRDEVKGRIKKYRVRPLARPSRPPHANDFARLARRLCGKSIGVVLGGGGARGISHLGMLQALEEQSIPVDAIGGCSIGAMVGGLYARETDILSTTGRLKQFSGRMGSIWRILSDVTYPYASYTTGHEFNRGIYKTFLDMHIEDMWIPYFCNSTNITHSKMEVHRTGYAWRYVRASMTLAGLLPPLSDRGNLLVDGGYMDNLPVSTMFSLGPQDVIAVDVGAIDDNSPRNYGDSVSGWWIMLSRLNPFAQQPVLSMTEVSSRLA